MREKTIKNKKLTKKKRNTNEKSKMCDMGSTLESVDFDKALLSNYIRGFLKIMILWIITKERIHGYDIIKKMKEGKESKNFDFESPGANKIYPILHELEEKELIVGDWELQGKRKIKFYEATEKGKNTIEIVRKRPHSNLPPIVKEFWNDVMTSHKSSGEIKTPNTKK
jgi:DNA-binding PadR family transcriptional regulator